MIEYYYNLEFDELEFAEEVNLTLIFGEKSSKNSGIYLVLQASATSEYFKREADCLIKFKP
jgi:hypothetical protein